MVLMHTALSEVVVERHVVKSIIPQRLPWDFLSQSLNFLCHGVQFTDPLVSPNLRFFSKQVLIHLPRISSSCKNNKIKCRLRVFTWIGEFFASVRQQNSILKLHSIWTVSRLKKTIETYFSLMFLNIRLLRKINEYFKSVFIIITK